MNFIFLNQYYPPDTAPTGVMVKSVAEQLVNAGHEVTVVCAEGGYSGKVEKSEDAVSEARNTGLSIVRLKAFSLGRSSAVAKILDYASYYLGVAWFLLLHPADRVVALTTPPYLSLLARFFTKLRGGTHGHWVMDLYPDVMFAHGILSEGGVPSQILRVLARWGMGGSRCAGVVTLGEDMCEKLSQYLPAETPIKCVPLWATATPDAVSADDIYAWREKRGWEENELICLYSGNMGLGHRFPEFLETARRSAGRGVKFVFAGRGKRKEEVEQFVQENPSAPIEVMDYVAHADLAVHLASANVHLASMEPSWDGTMVPSKLQGIFTIGRPVIFVGSDYSSIGRWVGESGAGWVIAPDDISALEKALEEAQQQDVITEMGQKALAFAKDKFDMQINAAMTFSVFL